MLRSIGVRVTPQRSIHHRSLNAPRANSVDANIVWAEVAGKVPGKTQDTRLGSRVGRRLPRGCVCLHGRRVDDASAPSLDHRGHYAGATQENALQIDRDLSLPVFNRYINKFAVEFHAYVVYQYIDDREF